MFVFLLALSLIAILYFNRLLYLRTLLLESQISLFRSHFRRKRIKIRIPENFRRLWVWVSRVSDFWKDACLVFQPATIIAWERRRYRDFWTLRCNTGRGSGRPEIPEELQELIVRLAEENPAWQAGRIRKELKVLGYRVHTDTVRKYMPVRSPDPTRQIRWRKFLQLNMPRIAAMDFFFIPRAGSRFPLVAFFVIAHDRRRLLHINVTEHPTAEWIQQQLLLAFGADSRLRFLIQDNDALFKPIQKFITAIQLRSVKTGYRSPWMNGIAERFVRTVREELLNFVVVDDEVHIRRLLLEYREYYNQDRCHSTLEGDSPDGRCGIDRPPDRGKVVRIPRVSGLHSRYEWREVA